MVHGEHHRPRPLTFLIGTASVGYTSIIMGGWIPPFSTPDKQLVSMNWHNFVVFNNSHLCSLVAGCCLITGELLLRIFRPLWVQTSWRILVFTLALDYDFFKSEAQLNLEFLVKVYNRAWELKFLAPISSTLSPMIFPLCKLTPTKLNRRLALNSCR